MRVMRRFVATCILLTTTVVVRAQIITTAVGTGTPGSSGDGGQATNARIENAYQLTMDGKGNLYIADYVGNRVRKVSKSGIITTIAGGGGKDDNVPATDASLNGPIGVAADSRGNIYVSEYGGGRVRKIDRNGIISTLSAGLAAPTHLCVDRFDNLFIANQMGHNVIKVTPDGASMVYAGNGSHGYSGDGGPAADASLCSVSGISADNEGNIYISCWDDGHIRKVNPDGIITTIAGCGKGFDGDGGPAIQARFDQPYGICSDAAGNLYIADNANHRIRYVSAATGIVTTIAGTGNTAYNGDDIPATDANINSSSLCIGRDGSYYFNEGARIRKVDGLPLQLDLKRERHRPLHVKEPAAPPPVSQPDIITIDLNNGRIVKARIVTRKRKGITRKKVKYIWVEVGD